MEDFKKTLFVKDLKPGMNDVIDYFMVKEVAVKIGSSGKQYLDLKLGDTTGEITAKKWDVSDSDTKLERKDIVKVLGRVDEFMGRPQVRVQKIRQASLEEAGAPITDFVKAAPESSEDMYEYIFGVASELTDEDLKKIAVSELTANKEKLMYYPGAQSMHHAIYGGLLYHTARMLRMGERVCDVYTDLKRDWVCAGIILHDMQKINEIEADKDGVAIEYSLEGKMLGHLVSGVKHLDAVCEEFGVSEEKKLMLEHMILAHHYEPEYGSPRKPLFPEAEVLHYIDILDARMYDFEEALELTEPGGFSERIYSLDNRRVYKPSFDK